MSHEFNSNELCLLFQRLDDNPFSIEIMFEYTKYFNFFAPVGSEDSWRSEIDYAKIVKTDKWFYWTTWEDFDPNNQEHLKYNDFILISSMSVVMCPLSLVILLTDILSLPFSYFG